MGGIICRYVGVSGGLHIPSNHGSEVRNGNLGRFRFLMKMGFWGGIDHRGVIN